MCYYLLTLLCFIKEIKNTQFNLNQFLKYIINNLKF